MRRAYGSILGLALVFAITVGAPVALSGVNAPIATAVLSLFVDEAAAQAETNCANVGSVGALGLAAPLSGDCPATSIESEGGDASSSSGRGGTGGLAILHELISTTATSDTSLSLTDSPTGDIHNEVTYIIEDTDETVVINQAGNPGSTGIHVMNVGAPSHAVNTGGNIGSADASGGDSGDATAHGGDSRPGDVLLGDVVTLLLP